MDSNYHPPLMSAAEAVTKTLDELIDPRTRYSILHVMFAERALQKMGTVHPSFNSAVMTELNKQLFGGNESYRRFYECLKELKQL
jgi:hypothetical protein